MMFLTDMVLLMLLGNLAAAENVQGIVAGLEEFIGVVKSLSEQSNKIKDSLPKLSLEISESIQKNPQVTVQKEKLDNAKKNGQPVAECEQIFDEKYHLVVEELRKILSKKITDELKEIQDFLQYTEETTKMGIDKLKSSNVSTAVVNEIISQSEVDFHVVNRMKNVLETKVKNALNDLDREFTAKVLRDNFLKPVAECVENHKIIES